MGSGRFWLVLRWGEGWGGGEGVGARGFSQESRSNTMSRSLSPKVRELIYFLTMSFIVGRKYSTVLAMLASAL